MSGESHTDPRNSPASAQDRERPCEARCTARPSTHGHPLRPFLGGVVGVREAWRGMAAYSALIHQALGPPCLHRRDTRYLPSPGTRSAPLVFGRERGCAGTEAHLWLILLGRLRTPWILGPPHVGAVTVRIYAPDNTWHRRAISACSATMASSRVAYSSVSRRWASPTSALVHQ